MSKAVFTLLVQLLNKAAHGAKVCDSYLKIVLSRIALQDVVGLAAALHSFSPGRSRLFHFDVESRSGEIYISSTLNFCSIYPPTPKDLS